jgi:hypothetical protein
MPHETGQMHTRGVYSTSVAACCFLNSAMTASKVTLVLLLMAAKTAWLNSSLLRVARKRKG